MKLKRGIQIALFSLIGIVVASAFMMCLMAARYRKKNGIRIPGGWRSLLTGRFSHTGFSDSESEKDNGLETGGNAGYEVANAQGEKEEDSVMQQQQLRRPRADGGTIAEYYNPAGEDDGRPRQNVSTSATTRGAAPASTGRGYGSDCISPEGPSQSQATTSERGLRHVYVNHLEG